MLARGAGCSPTSVGDGKTLAILQHAAQHLPEQVERLCDACVPQAVVDGLAVAPRDDQSLVAQYAEVLGEVALPQADALDQLTDRARTISKLVDDQEPGRVGQRLAE